ncbi:hypothetical protein IC220_02620 [Wolbachia endosymbiont of Pentalonia nigronervosa]|uniref:hypothetical protein n=1 Tax=Wolbachia endosymbiont of Pentalonia nigronervosa TaxID=1301914 RepID=UPI00165F94B0|nr:hypothetical protein [Wolbachia endosymbiont of Pentalonia nigronervosa]MBD0391352.1 hypothetical protein [Wolbachia endosymbiont of Pentalonia nigronervosa]
MIDVINNDAESLSLANKKFFEDMGIECLKKANTPQKCNVSDAQIYEWTKDISPLELQNRLSGQQSTTSRLHSETDYEALGSESLTENIDSDPEIDFLYYNNDIPDNYYVHEYEGDIASRALY